MPDGPGGAYKPRMATDSDLVTAINTAISTVLANIAQGKLVTEYREGAISVKRESPAALLQALKDMKAAVSNDSGTGRCASVGVFRGAV